MRITTRVVVAFSAVLLAIGGAAAGWAVGSAAGSPSQPQNVHPSAARPSAFIDTSTEAKYTAINPCRIVDTRAGGGKIAANATRTFQVTGTTGFSGQGGVSTGCNVPASANAVAATVVAVDENGPGFLVGWPTGSPQPASSFLNYANTNLVSTGVTLTINSSINIAAGVSGTDVVIDIDGYYVKPMFAEINSNGTTAIGSRTTGSSPVSGFPGAYEVDFDRNVSACAYNVSVAINSPFVVRTEPRSGNVNGVFVYILTPGNTGTVNTFYLTVTC